LAAITQLAAVGIPVSVLMAPIIPGLNDEEIPRVLRAAADAGARSAGYVLLRLPQPVDRLFADWVDRHFPDRRERILGRIRECRNGRISDPRFGSRMRGEGVYAEHIGNLFRTAARKCGLDQRLPPLSTAAFRRPPQSGEQLRLY
jgi:DNA repair photolyase